MQPGAGRRLSTAMFRAAKTSDTQDAPWTAGLGPQPSTEGLTPSEVASRNVYFGLPLLLGLIGIAFHVQRDWRRALAVFVLFLVTGDLFRAGEPLELVAEEFGIPSRHLEAALRASLPAAA